MALFPRHAALVDKLHRGGGVSELVRMALSPRHAALVDKLHGAASEMHRW